MTTGMPNPCTRDRDCTATVHGGLCPKGVVRHRYCKTCDFYTDHVSTAHDGLAERGLLLPREAQK